MDLEKTIAEIAPGLLAYATGLGGAQALGEEAAQEALTALVGYWRRQGPPDSPRAFAYTVARRVVRRALWKRRLTRPLEAVLGRPRVDPGPEEIARWRHELGRTIAALECLSRRERDAILLAATGDLDAAEAARILGLSRSGFKMRVHRARQRLQRHLERNHGSKRQESLEGSGAGTR